MTATRADALEFGAGRRPNRRPRAPASIEEKRLNYLKQMAQVIWQNAPYLGTRNMPITLYQFVPIAGPRAGGLKIFAGFSSGLLYQKLTADKAALARQLITWPFAGPPAISMDGKSVRIEAGWTKELSETKIRLADAVNLSAYRGRWKQVGGRWMLNGGGQFVLGKDEQGRVIVRHLNAHDTPHYLVAGTTGSGKTVFLLLLLIQLAADPNNRIVVIDGKRGRDLKGNDFFPFSIETLNGYVAPMACTPEEWLSALIWLGNELSHRMENPDAQEKRLVVVIDEVQEVIKILGDVAKEVIRRLVQLGRSCNVHVILATQHPVVDELGGSTVARMLSGRIALRVTDADASRVAVGASDPRADKLLGKGDLYSIAPASLYRAQGAYPEIADAEAVHTIPPELAAWPEVEISDLGQPPDGGDARSKPYTPQEHGASLISAHFGEGRPKMEARVREMAGEGTGGARSKRLLQWGRDVHRVLGDVGFELHDTTNPEKDTE